MKVKKSLNSILLVCQVFIIIFFLIQTGFSQIGLKTSYSLASYSSVEERLNRQFEYDENIFRNNFGFGLFYRYQIESTGFELLPGINLQFSPKDNFGLSYQRYMFEMPIIIYPLNMEGDCGCPDFSIRNKFFEKHLFFIIAPSLNYEKKTIDKDNLVQTFNNIYFKVGVGVGFLIPVTEKISIAPGVLFNWAFNDKWDKSFFNEAEIKDITISYNDVKFELRFNYKF